MKVIVRNKESERRRRRGKVIEGRIGRRG